MQLQLQQLRKSAGYKSRDDFAAVLGINPLTYKGWETGRTRLKLEDACLIADILKCSLDELAGRYDYVGTYSDARQEAMNRDYLSLDEPSKDAASAAIRGMAALCAQAGQGARDPAAAV